MQELLQASGYAALVYLLFSYLVSFGSGRPLVEWINPGRRFLPLLAVGLLGASYSLLLRGVWRYQSTHHELLLQLFNEEKAKPEVVGAVSFTCFALAILMLFLWTWWNLPRDPRTFSANPNNHVAEYRRALRHFTHWKGGIDFAFLAEVRNGVTTIVAEGASERDIRKGLYRLPDVPNELIDNEPRKAIEDQKEIWRKEAEVLFRDLPRLDELVRPVRQGSNVTFCFDVQFGAFYFELIERDAARPEAPTCLYLFAASLNEHEVSTMTAGRHFYSMAEAIRYIRRGVTKR